MDFIPLAEGLSAPHDADGTATHLGRYHAEGLVRLDHFTGPTTAEFSSAVPVVFTAANGDELHFDYAGTVELIPLGGGLFVTVWVAEFTPAAGSTGRFAKVIGGSFVMTAVTDPFALGDTDIAYAWEGAVPGVPPGEVTTHRSVAPGSGEDPPSPRLDHERSSQTMRTTRWTLVVLTVVARLASAGECLANTVPYKTRGTGV